MKRLTAVLLATLPALLAGCVPPPDHTQKVRNIADVEALFRINICDKAEVASEGPNLFMGTRDMVIDFPDRSCVEDFFRAMKRGGRAEDIVDDMEYFRIIGGQQNPDTLFSVDRIGDTKVILRLSGGRWGDSGGNGGPSSK